MTAGRKPLPIQLHVLNGNPSKLSPSELQKIEPKVDPSMPEVPEEIREDKDCHDEWQRIVPDLHQAGLLKKIDRTAIMNYCIAYGEWVKAIRAIRKARLIRNKQGTYSINPMFRVANEMAEQMRKYLSEFGMTPSSRAKLKAPPPETEDEFEKKLFD